MNEIIVINFIYALWSYSNIVFINSYCSGYYNRSIYFDCQGKKMEWMCTLHVGIAVLDEWMID